MRWCAVRCTDPYWTLPDLPHKTFSTYEFVRLATEKRPGIHTLALETRIASMLATVDAHECQSVRGGMFVGVYVYANYPVVQTRTNPSLKDPKLAHSIQFSLHNSIDILARGKGEWIFDKLHRQSWFLFDPTFGLCLNELFGLLSDEVGHNT